MLSYISLQFLIFIAAFFALYFAVPGVRAKQAVILIGNLVFYRYAGGLNALCFVVLASLVAYGAGRLMERVYADFILKSEGLEYKDRMSLLSEYKKKTIRFVILGLMVIVGIMVYTKAGRMAGWNSVESVLKIRPLRSYLAPLGVSYYSLSLTGYLLDVYWRKAEAEHNYLKLLLCTSYFPTIIQGPIMKYPGLIRQFDELPGFDFRRVSFGLQLALYGLIKKIVIADRLAVFPQTIFSDIGSYQGLTVVLAVIFNVLTLYFDFSGCMDVVTGMAQMMGIKVDKNFNHPFFSKTPAEFWRRWHITLGAWFKEYVYMPIAVSPRFIAGAARIKAGSGITASKIYSTAVPLIVVWTLTGLWHGTGIDYLLWGWYWGILIILEAVFAKQLKDIEKSHESKGRLKAYDILRMALTFVIFAVGRMFTALGMGVHNAVPVIFGRIFAGSDLGALVDGSLFSHGLSQREFLICILGIILVWIVDCLQERGMSVRERLSEQHVIVRWAFYIGAVMIIILFGVYGAGFDASGFAYGGF